MSAPELRFGDWREVLSDVRRADALICDPPYSERTHAAYREMAEVGRSAIRYEAFSERDVFELVDAWAPRVSGWIAVMCDHGLVSAYERALASHDRYVFAPLACMEPGSRVRLSGDGPAQWSVWLVVSRPKDRAFQRWGALPGGYVVGASDGWRGSSGKGGRSGVTGGKPLSLMRSIIRDYTRPGDLVVDPFAGGGTTLLAAALEGRRAIGAERDPKHYAIAEARLASGYTPPLFVEGAGRLAPEQVELTLAGESGDGEEVEP